MSIPERCFLCAHWDHQHNECLRVVRMTVVVGEGGGSIDLQTTPGLIPVDLENALLRDMTNALSRIIDAWPGWKEIREYREGKDAGGHDCAAREEMVHLKPYLHIVTDKEDVSD